MYVCDFDIDIPEIPKEIYFEAVSLVSFRSFLIRLSRSVGYLGLCTSNMAVFINGRGKTRGRSEML